MRGYNSDVLPHSAASASASASASTDVKALSDSSGKPNGKTKGVDSDDSDSDASSAEDSDGAESGHIELSFCPKHANAAFDAADYVRQVFLCTSPRQRFCVLILERALMHVAAMIGL
jgi:hypothetical protein